MSAPLNAGNETNDTRWIRVIAVALLIVAIVVGGAALWQHFHRPKLMTLSEALWVTNRDFTRYYAPNTPEFRAIAEALASQGVAATEPRFDSFVIYRQGLTDVDSPREPLLIVGFDPTTIPSEHKTLSR
jgi:hypothetical protein